MSEEFAALCSRLTRRAWHDEAAALQAENERLREALAEIAHPKASDERDLIGMDWNAAEEIARKALSDSHRSTASQGEGE